MLRCIEILIGGGVHLRFGIAAETPPVPALSLINKEAARATEVQTDQLKAHRKGYQPMTVALQSDRLQVTPPTHCHSQQSQQN